MAIYSHEDRFALHRFKADEAYTIGKPGEPICDRISTSKAFSTLPRVTAWTRSTRATAFCRRIRSCRGPASASASFFVARRPEVLEQLGDKVAARRIAATAGVPVLAGSDRAPGRRQRAGNLADKLGYPVMLKAAKGGGGRGMRVVNTADELAASLEQAQRESQAAFGSDEVFIEKFISRPRHIEVQLMGDKHGDLVHLYERDCSLQRRHQKVVEIAPALCLDPRMREAICQAALDIGRAVHYENAGTVEFLLDTDTEKFYFIEVNPRIQVEHTVTEAVTGIDIVQEPDSGGAGARLSTIRKSASADQDCDPHDGFAIQCRVTTEDPENRFLPDYGRIAHYRSAGGVGIRLDARHRVFRCGRDAVSTIRCWSR